MKHFYLFFSIFGAIVPYIFFIQHFQNVGFGLKDFLNGLFANGAAAGFTADIFISSFVFWIFIVTEKRAKNIWIYVFLNLTIGLSCALPAYLYFREKNKLRPS